MFGSDTCLHWGGREIGCLVLLETLGGNFDPGAIVRVNDAGGPLFQIYEIDGMGRDVFAWSLDAQLLILL